MVKYPFMRDQIGFVSFAENAVSLVLEINLTVCQILKFKSMIVVAVALYTVFMKKIFFDNFLVFDQFFWT